MDEKTLYSELGKLRASKRRHVVGTCEQCGKPIEGIAKRRYCGNTCAARAYRQRQREHPQAGVAEADTADA